MDIKTIVVGPIKENCYVLKKGNNVLVIDPGDEFDKIKETIKDLNVVGILITHAHFDHIGALKDLVEYTNANVYYNNINNEIDDVINIKEGKYKIKDFEFEVISFKGHRNDLCAFYFEKEKVMFTGDFLFKLSIGRTDLEYGNDKDMFISLKKILDYDPEIIIYPGHGDSTSLGYEFEFNNFLKF